jgi:DNA replication and repair protein RecF
LNKIKLYNFRNYSNLEVSFAEGINIIYGKNAQGKTNLLESIYFLAITKSHRSFIDKNIIKSGNFESSVIGEVEGKTYKVTVKNKEKKLYINNVQIKKIEEYVGEIKVVIFCPDDIEIIKGSPQERRRLLNIAISQIENKYLLALHEYNNILKQRNTYLKEKRINDPTYFEILTDQLCEKALIIHQYREKYISDINETISHIYEKIASEGTYKIKYSFYPSGESYLENLKNEFKNKINQELKLGATLFGPHRDDLYFEIDDQNIKEYGSQGQQRLTMICFKIAELERQIRTEGSKPILLLDDVFSELDDEKKNNILKYIDKNVQTFITTTDIKSISKEIVSKSNIFRIEEGKINIIDKVK